MLLNMLPRFVFSSIEMMLLHSCTDIALVISNHMFKMWAENVAASVNTDGNLTYGVV